MPIDFLSYLLTLKKAWAAKALFPIRGIIGQGTLKRGEGSGFQAVGFSPSEINEKTAEPKYGNYAAAGEPLVPSRFRTTLRA